MSTLSVLVVEDEPLARDMICTLLERAEGVALAGTCGNAQQAEQRVAAAPPDILLLDVEMPGDSGLDMIRSLRPEQRPAVVFVTAHEEYALQAFDESAVDYVLKPFSDERFLEAVERARCRVLERRVSRVAAQMAADMSELSPGTSHEPFDGGSQPDKPSAQTAQVATEYLSRLAIPKAGRKLLVPVEEVRWIESDDYYVRIHSEAGAHLLRASLNDLEKRLDPTKFIRVHRGAIVRLDAVHSVRRCEHGARVLQLRSGDQVRVARARFRAVEERLVPKIGIARPSKGRSWDGLEDRVACRGAICFVRDASSER